MQENLMQQKGTMMPTRSRLWIVRLKAMASIDRFMLLPKAAYFLSYLHLGIIQEYNSTFLKDVGLTLQQAGFINGIRAILTILGAVVFSMVANHTKQHRIIVPTLAALSALSLLSIPWLAAMFTPQQCVSGEHELETLQRNTILNTTSFIESKFVRGEHPNNTRYELNSKYANSSTQPCDESSKNAMGIYETMLGLNLLTGFLSGPLQCCADSIVSMHVHLAPGRASLSHQLRFCYIGWASGALLTGVFADILPIHGVSPYAWTFLLPALSISLYGIVMFKLYKSTAELQNEKHSTVAENLKQDDQEKSVQSNAKSDTGMTKIQAMAYTMRSPHVLLFFFTAMIIQVGVGTYGGYLFIYLGSIGATSTVFGLTSWATRVAVILTCSLAEPLNKLVGGELRTIALSCMIYAVRCLLVSLLHNPWFAILYMILTPFEGHNIASSLQIISKIAPKHLRTVMFGLHDSTQTMGLVLGYISGGVIYQKLGGRGLFRLASIVFASWSLLLFLYKLIFKEDKYKQIGEAVNGPDEVQEETRTVPSTKADQEVLFITNV